MSPRRSLAAAAVCLIAVLALATAATAVHADEPAHCVGCLDGQPTEGCPLPQQCGYAPILCVDCMDMVMPKCPNATWCANVECDATKVACKDGVPTASCPDPGTCGFKPIPCFGCTPGQFRYGCPDAALCYQNMTTLPCMDCKNGTSTAGCDDAEYCIGPGPVPSSPPECTDCMSGMTMPECPYPVFCTPSPTHECIDCMAGMAMPHCPYPDMCPTDPCMMMMYFGASTSTCLFFQSWHVGNSGQWAGAFFGILLLAILREGLSVYRVHKHLTIKQDESVRRMMQRDLAAARAKEDSVANGSPPHEQSTNSMQMRTKPLLTDVGGRYKSVARDGGSDSPVISFEHHLNSTPPSELSLHFFDSFYYLVSLVLGYLLMLVIMTYNVWLCLITVLCCFICHFACNYSYHAFYKRRYLHKVKCLVQAWRDEHGTVVAAADDSTGVVIEANTAKPASGDHCCDDLAFDDI